MKIKETLYGEPKNGSAKQWSVFVEDDKVIVEWGRVGGKLQTKETICTPKNVGKANETSPHEQAMLEALAKWQKQHDNKLYRTSIKEAESVGKLLPMLAIDGSKKPEKIKFPCDIQPKLDGCFKYDTRIWTDKGYLKIGYIVENRLPVKVYSKNLKTGKLELKKVVNYFNNGLSDSGDFYKVLTDENQIIATGNHKIYTDKGWVCVDKLEETDCKVLSSNNLKDFQAFILGSLLGDSCASFEKRWGNSYRIIFSVCDSDESYGDRKSEYYSKICSVNKSSYTSGYGSNCKRYTIGKCTSLPFDISVLYETNKNSDNYGKRLEHLDVKELKDYFSDISLAVWYFDDGTYHENNSNPLTPRLSLSVARYSDQTIKGFVKLFKDLYNVKPTVVTTEKDKTLWFDTPSSCYLLFRIASVASGFCDRKLKTFANEKVEIGDVSMEVFKKPIVRNLPNVKYSKYDIEVEDNHNYFAENILVHNCRAMVFLDEDNQVKAISRQGKIYELHKQLEDELHYLLTTNNYERLDGELYYHGMKLQNIVSAVRNKENPNHSIMQFHIFDIPSDEVWSKRKQTMLMKDGEFVKWVPYTQCDTESQLQKSVSEFMAEGYEGTIVRNLKGKYEYNHRSNDLIKVKVMQDSEAKVIACREDRNGEGVLTCYWNGIEFDVKMKGSHEERLYSEQCTLIGQWINFSYQALTEDGKPQFPSGNYIRECDSNGQPLE
jgi:predicted DNA-binding WGR domain protein